MNRESKTISCSIGIMAYNEEANIRFLLESLLKQRIYACEIVEIVVVASGCTDGTCGIVEAICEENSIVKLLVQEEREGKASAINLFLKSAAESDVFVIESGDTIPEEDTIENLVRPFVDSTIGMTGAHPVPVNSLDSFIGFTVNLFWSLHHELALNHPKLGELIAFRNIVREMPKDTAVDEASIEAIITNAGYRIHYAKDAIVRNKGPETIKDFLRQRRRITAGHKHLQVTKGYQVSSMKIVNLAPLVKRLLVQVDVSWNLKTALWTFGAICLELIGRVLGDFDYYIKKKNPVMWDIAESTKNLMNAPTDT